MKLVRTALILVVLLAALCSAPPPAVAMAEGSSAPVADATPVVPTAPAYVAMLFYRLSGQRPDFDAWAMASDAYIKANDFDKDLVRREKAAEAAHAYSLITYEEPVVIAHPVQLSSYSRTRQGFFVQNFKPDTFYSFNFLKRDYAMIPLDLIDYQWLSLQDTAAMERMNRQVVADEGRARMILWITPVSADKDNPMKISDKNYWLLSGKVKKLQIYDKAGKILLWEGFSREEAAQNRQQVLDLYK